MNTYKCMNFLIIFVSGLISIIRRKYISNELSYNTYFRLDKYDKNEWYKYNEGYK